MITVREFSPVGPYDTDGWPYFVGVNERRTGKTDEHVAIGIQSLEHAHLIAAAPAMLEVQQIATHIEAVGESDPMIAEMARAAIDAATT